MVKKSDNVEVRGKPGSGPTVKGKGKEITIPVVSNGPRIVT